MSYADQVFRRNCEDILKNGVWDTELAVRPRWEDGTPAHTVKKFGIVNRYDLREEFPILTHAPHLFEERGGRAFVDLAEKIQQRPRPLTPTSGTPGRMRAAASARPTATSSA